MEIISVNLLVLMRIKVLSWNVRGLNVGEKKAAVKACLKEWTADEVKLMTKKKKAAQHMSRHFDEIFGDEEWRTKQ